MDLLRKRCEISYNEAEGEPRVALDDLAVVVAAVVTLAYHAFVAFHLLPEGVLAAGEDQTHRGAGEGWFPIEDELRGCGIVSCAL